MIHVPYLQNTTNPGIAAFSDFDFHFAQFVVDHSEQKPAELFAVAMLLSRCNQEGHVCIDVNAIDRGLLDALTHLLPSPLAPGTQWTDILSSCSAVGAPGDFRPIIIDNNLIYLHKYWYFETYIAERLNTLAQEQAPVTEAELVTALLDKYFPEDLETQNAFRMAAVILTLKQLCIVTGGPGTGKTFAAITLCAFLQELFWQKKWHIGLAAPTGKAAARLDESVRSAKEKNLLPASVCDAISGEAQTIHRFIGLSRNSNTPAYNEDNPLPVDIAVIDEASMIDIATMTRFLKAIPARCKVILIGDRDQLASVQAGSVFGDICSPDHLDLFSDSFIQHAGRFFPLTQSLIPSSNQCPPLADCLVRFTKTYRFTGAIAQCSAAVCSGNKEQVLAILKNPASEALSWTELPNDSLLPESFKSDILTGWHRYLKARTLEEMFSSFNTFRVLCALRNGEFGSERINALIEKILLGAGLPSADGPWYPGRPVMVTQNDYTLNLYNGDTGIIAPDPQQGDVLKAWFPAVKNTQSRAFRSFALSRLSSLETCFATTVHKSQGSEYESIILLLPPVDSPVLTRELIYTGLTRSRGKVHIYGKGSVFIKGIDKRIERWSGLKRRLYGG